MTKNSEKRETEIFPHISAAGSNPERIHPSYEEIARLAYLYWAARGGQGSSREEAWLRAERELQLNRKLA
jgi:hypothetical protein